MYTQTASSALTGLRQHIRQANRRDENTALQQLLQAHAPSAGTRDRAQRRAIGLVQHLREDASPGLMEVFLAEYGLSTDEGIALMCLAEALLRVPDADTIDALIEDKIAPSAWGKHLGHSSSPLVNASTWALMLTGRILREDPKEQGIAATLQGAVKRMGEPVIRAAVARAMRELGAQFVLGQSVKEAIERGRPMTAKGYTYSYDMLGEAALTEADAQTYFSAYSHAIAELAAQSNSSDIAKNPGISIKLSALHPRYEVSQRDRVLCELVERTSILVRQAREAKMGLNIDAEEAERLDLSLDVIEAVLSDPGLAGWDGFGVVVQAYGTRAPQVIDWLHELACSLDRRIMVRLVKGAYWDTEIKRAQVEGLARFPVYTRKAATDMAWICCADKLMGMTGRIFPQFATHNAHSAASVLEIACARGIAAEAYEFQRLHGMGEALHDRLRKTEGTRCRIYAPVGAHRDLLAYLVRRLLENGANSSFVNQVLDTDVPPGEIAADPFNSSLERNAAVRAPLDLYQPERRNSRGWDLHDADDLTEIDDAMAPFMAQRWDIPGNGDRVEIRNPADPADSVGSIAFADAVFVRAAIAASEPWDATAKERACILNAAADLYEHNFGELFALITREAGKTRMDAVSELREAVDFLRYYAARGLELTQPPLGRVACISPWNFPLAIFTGQITAALAAGNAVLAKPAEQTSLTASVAVRLLHRAGVPETVLALLPGRGAEVGAALTSDPGIDGICFTGSTDTAQHINRSMAEHLDPASPLIAETGGLNAMIVDSTALPEQAVRDILASAFQSAGQRCSALRVLYIQEDVADPLLKMLFGAMDELRVADPKCLSTDVGPVIDESAAETIRVHVDIAHADGRVLKKLEIPTSGTFVPPTVINVNGIQNLDREIFGPVLHVATYAAGDLDRVVDAINDAGYGLTFGMHSRIDDRIEQVASRIRCGNVYINRNQIGAIVGSQPFGGEGLSGTGPKAGGPDYVARFTRPEGIDPPEHDDPQHRKMTPEELRRVQRRIDQIHVTPVVLSAETLPGPTGESNRLSRHGRGVVLCLGPTTEAAVEQAHLADAAGCAVLMVAEGVKGKDAFAGTLPPEALRTLTGIDAVVSWHDRDRQRAYRLALANRPGPLIPLITEKDVTARCWIERHVCIDTTAAGGNASLLAGAA